MFSLLLAVIATACPAHADKRVALLIGNGKYAAVGALANPRNDVLLLKKALDAGSTTSRRPSISDMRTS